ncbi:MAG: DNA-deoxyinosine glycosylase [bacterium]|nr:DNA-deoxyinosine glycosylase [bacterium]
MIESGLNPIYDEKTAILIVGTFPSQKSLQSCEYYGNRLNHFWRILSAITGRDLDQICYKKRIETLLSKKIGLWDTIKKCEREGSLDKKIKSPTFNSFTRFSGLRLIVCNGNDAYRYSSECRVSNSVTVRKVISSSPAAAVRIEKKISLWKSALSD